MSLSVLHPGDMARVKATGQMARILAYADTWEPPVYIVDGAEDADGEPTFEEHELEPAS